MTALDPRPMPHHRPPLGYDGASCSGSRTASTAPTGTRAPGPSPTHLYEKQASTAGRKDTLGFTHSKVSSMYSRLLIVAAALTVGVACDTNVRDVYASDAILSTDGERIATVRSRYEHYNNLVTEGTGPGSRDHEFSVYTWRTPDVSGIGASTMRSFPDGQGERFVYQGHLNGAQYVHNGTRRFIVGAYSNTDRETRAGLLRIDADGRPRGGWRLIGDGAPVNIDISRDGALIAVATTVSTGEGRDAFAVKIYDGDSLAVVHTHQFSSGPESGGSVSGAWHKAPRGLDAATIGSEAFERLQMEKNLVHPASPGWPAQHDAVMEQVSTQRTLADFEWSYLAIARRWSNRRRR